MRFSIATIGAVTLGTSVMAQAEEAKNIVGIPVLKELQEVEGQWKFDACHKVDSAVDGLIWPCASQLRTRVKFCPKSATTAEERKSQRDCLCGEGSSFLPDAVACSECKMQNGLQPETQREHWVKYYKEVDDKYCQAKDVPQSFEQFSTELNNRMPVPEGGRNFNLHVGKVIDPRAYYTSAKLEVPKQQGAGKFTPAKAPVGNNNATTVAVEDPLAGQVRVPIFIAVETVPTVNDTKSSSSIRPIATAPFSNNTASIIKPTSSVVDVKPSTFLTITTTSSTAQATTSLLPATSLAPAPGGATGPVEEHTIVINGQKCIVLIMWVIVDCTPKTDAGGNFVIDFKNIGIDKKEPAMKLDNSAQFDKIKDSMADASKNEKLAEQCKERVGTTAPVVAAPGNNKELLPAKNAGELTAPKKNNGTPGSQPANDVEICPDGTEIPKTQKGSNGGSEAGVPTKPTTGTPAQNPGSKPVQNPSNGPAKNPSNGPAQSPSSGPAKNPSNGPAQNPSNGPAQSPSNGPAKSPSSPAQNAGSRPGNSTPQPDSKDCVCPTASSASAIMDATEICAKKVKTETDCKALSGDNVRKCLCSEAGFEDKRFFDEAIICSRRSGDLRQGEFEAQVFFETKARFCERKQFDDFAAAYGSVNNEWREARAPTALLI